MQYLLNQKMWFAFSYCPTSVLIMKRGFDIIRYSKSLFVRTFFLFFKHLVNDSCNDALYTKHGNKPLLGLFVELYAIKSYAYKH